MNGPTSDFHAINSVLREIILEHLFIGQLLQSLWRRGVSDVEVLRSEFDAGGYDLVISRGDLVRHIQLKSKLVGGATSSVSVGLKLASRPSACVVWIVCDHGLATDHYLWFGGEPGTPLPDIQGMKITRHTKANASGEKGERMAHRKVAGSLFVRLNSIDELITRLIGPI